MKEAQKQRDWQVSIHTPTQGVTDTALASFAQAKFQSTHPRRVWQDIPVYAEASV